MGFTLADARSSGKKIMLSQLEEGQFVLVNEGGSLMTKTDEGHYIVFESDAFVTEFENLKEYLHSHEEDREVELVEVKIVFKSIVP